MHALMQNGPKSEPGKHSRNAGSHVGVSNSGIALTGPEMNLYQGSCYVSCNFGMLTRKMAPFWECFARTFLRTGRLIRLWKDYAGTGSILGLVGQKAFRTPEPAHVPCLFQPGSSCLARAGRLAAGCNCEFAGLLQLQPVSYLEWRLQT